ncbi:response regulator transcription factor [Agromyces aerolatus]|uniref:response regulator transcription factor n=1 Tax=Agromyces sp. LY-1074 TaxID=3074080 RepID=UPI00286206DC|nr:MULTISPECIES: response regulator transcription factor [unclassified Agromyces]MDR5698576.1 response regulator transcription factor [Agromyces sp. LY-1074]MDR5704870.1 response regulator transcription factor [Agromyces sp. LY-1358]
MPQERSITVVVVDDHPLFRRGIISLLDTLEHVQVVGDAATVDEAIDVVDATEPDVVLMDLDLGGGSGIDATKSVVRRHPSVAVLVLTMLGDDHSLFAAMRAGARGYLLKIASPREVERAIHAVADGEVLFGADVAQRAMAFLAGSTPDQSPKPFPELTDRESEVLDLVARGLDNGSIARTLVLTNKTVRNYVYGIITKLGAPDRSALIVIAREAGFGASRTATG